MARGNVLVSGEHLPNPHLPDYLEPSIGVATPWVLAAPAPMDGSPKDSGLSTGKSIVDMPPSTTPAHDDARTPFHSTRPNAPASALVKYLGGQDAFAGPLPGTVRDLKTEIQKKTGIEPDCQNLHLVEEWPPLTDRAINTMRFLKDEGVSLTELSLRKVLNSGEGEFTGDLVFVVNVLQDAGDELTAFWEEHDPVLKEDEMEVAGGAEGAKQLDRSKTARRRGGLKRSREALKPMEDSVRYRVLPNAADVLAPAVPSESRSSGGSSPAEVLEESGEDEEDLLARVMKRCRVGTAAEEEVLSAALKKCSFKGSATVHPPTSSVGDAGDVDLC